MALVDDTLAAPGYHDWSHQFFGEPSQFRSGAGGDYGVTGEQDGCLRSLQCRQGRIDGHRFGGSDDIGMDEPRNFLRALSRDDVLGEFEHCRSRTA